MVETATGSTVVSFGSAIRAGDANVRLVAPAERVAAGIAALKAWRTALAKEEGKPPYVYLSDAHITDIAERDPDTAARLARCKGIGPGKLESYGETILALLDELEGYSLGPRRGLRMGDSSPGPRRPGATLGAPRLLSS